MFKCRLYSWTSSNLICNVFYVNERMIELSGNCYTKLLDFRRYCLNLPQRHKPCLSHRNLIRHPEAQRLKTRRREIQKPEGTASTCFVSTISRHPQNDTETRETGDIGMKVFFSLLHARIEKWRNWMSPTLLGTNDGHCSSKIITTLKNWNRLPALDSCILSHIQHCHHTLRSLHYPKELQ